MTTTQDIENGMTSLKATKHTLPSRLVSLCEALRIRMDDKASAQGLSAEEISATGIFTAGEAEAIIFVLAETGGDLDYVDHFICHGW